MTRVKKIAIHNVVHSIEGDSSIVVANHAIPDNWKQASTMSQLITRINDDDTAIEGKTYVGTVSYSDLPEGLLQAELKIEITKGSTSGNKIIVFTIESENISPYHWERVSAYGRSGNWRSFLPNKTIDTTVTSGSSNLITSNAVYNAVASKLNGTVLTKTEYDAIQNKDVNKIYVVEESLANGVYILYTDGSLSAYNSLTSGKTPIGSVLKTDNVSIVIHPNEGENKSWSSDPYTEVSGVTTVANRVDAIVDYDGKTNTAAIITAGKNGTAFDFCTTLGGYLPSCGEMEQIRLNAENINTSLNLINGTVIDFDSKAYWTSTQRNSANAWYWIQPQKVWYSDIKTMNIYCRSVESFTSSLTYKLYQGTSLIASSDTISSLSELETNITTLESSKYEKPVSGIPASDLASGVIPVVPTISTDISSDATSDVKTASPKAVKTYVDNSISNVTDSRLVELTDLAYNALQTKDSEKVYIVKNATPSFGGLLISSGPLYYGSNGFELKDSWNYDSANSIYGKSNGSTYFSYVDIGKYFDADGNSFTGTTDIDNTNILNGWRVPTAAELATMTTGSSPGTSRSGATVNNTTGCRYALIRLSNVTHAGTITPYGLLLFPDNVLITGKTLDGINNNTITSNVTLSELQNYLNQGCQFFPCSGYFSITNNGDFWRSTGEVGYMLSSTFSHTANYGDYLSYCYALNYWTSVTVSGGTGINNTYCTVRLVKSAPDPTYKIYQGSVLISDSTNNSKINTLESEVAGIAELLTAL